MRNSLRSSRDFQRVYKGGKRYEGSLLTVFALPSEHNCHRLGVTASKKSLGQAFERNRAKRLIRETFRSSQISLGSLKRNYDWVLNGRRRILSAHLRNSQAEFERIIAAVAADEIPSE